MDPTATHTVSVSASRNLTEWDLGVDLAEETIDFVPDGAPVTVTRDVVQTATCNGCHDSLSAHGSTGRTTVPGCVMCHTPQSTDPDTGNIIDFKVMIHKIHRGAFLPSVQAGDPYQIIGFGGSVHDFSDVIYPPSDPDSTRQCQTCHPLGSDAAQANAWLTNPTRVSCGSCHDDVNFATGENHADLPQPTDNLCSNCHIPQGELEFDISIMGAHVTPRFSQQLPGVVFTIESVRNTSKGQQPIVNFTIANNEGNPLDANDFSTLALNMAGPTSDYSKYFRENASPLGGGGGNYTYTFERRIPEDATGSWTIGIEGRRPVNINAGTVNETSVNDAGPNVVTSFAVDGGEATARRTVVDLANCNACHVSLSLHGNLRNQIEYCVECHNPNTTDAPVRPEDQLPTESVDFRTMIHRIHTGKDLGREYIIYGFGGSIHDYSNVGYPGMRNNCAGCHVGESQQLPLNADLLRVTDPRGWLNPVGPESAACLSCHGTVQAASHALANTTLSGESCATCHGPGKQFSVDRVHAE